ncbi:hypothetical protein HY411_00915 [Candidatus Gottesmanbacteria bacterium]|nr:hypothetical protein [Candidatus Gottesmanbacteria bacterium]
MSISLTGRVTGKTMSVISFIALMIFLPLLLLAAYQTATIVSRATGKPAAIVVDASAVLPEQVDSSFMHAFAQGGEETGNWIEPVQKEVTGLRPKWIRIDHVYDFYDIVKNVGGVLTFDFSRLDPIIDTIRATSAIPVISLSYMPPAIAQEGKVINPPKNWEDWALVVQKTIEHISGPSGKNISDVYYEVWNEPDHEQFGGWKLTGEKNYLTLYRYAAKGAGQAKDTKPFYLGGPSTTGLYKEWITKLVESGERLDFFSWHSYLDDPKRFTQDQKNITSWLMRYPQAILTPKLITEFGFTGGKDSRYGKPFASAFTTSVFRQLAIGGPRGLFTFQLKDGPGQELGDGWGLISHESQGKILKPRYHVFAFLDRMVGNRVNLTGEGTWVSGLASKREATIRVLLVNFDPSGNHTETVPVTITNLDNGLYEYQQQYLQGNAPDVRSVQRETVESRMLSKQLFMPAQSVVLIELYPVSRR